MLSTQNQTKKKLADHCFQFGHWIEVKQYGLCSSEKRNVTFETNKCKFRFYSETLGSTYISF